MAAPVSHHLVSASKENSGHRVVCSFGIVRGITVRSHSVIGNFGAAPQRLAGGNSTSGAELCEKSREDAFELMLKHAATMGANAVRRMGYDANDVAAGVTEMMAYGTALLVDPEI